ncbi:androglobin-like [Lingula anatina]|uniref:Androglobin-like n=1 Tax=Lingula anatina TaxID=7574 RepID=A0A1S3KBY4_LINAN|nr:androglobin-like [Lingula anatina]|eukprot:XP_013419771.1 androglobin-like [Lingula anatina]
MRRGSTQPMSLSVSKKRGGKDSKAAPGEIKEGDIFYRTVRIYPSHPLEPEEQHVTITRPEFPPGVVEVPHHRQRSAAHSETTSRRGSVMSLAGTERGNVNRDEATTPREETDRDRCLFLFPPSPHIQKSRSRTVRIVPAVETASLASKPSGSKPGTPSGKKKKEVGSAAKKEEASPKPEPKKGLGSPGKERKKSSTVRDRTDSIKSKDSKMEKDPKSAASLPRGADATPSVVFDPNAPHAEGEEEQAAEQTPEPPKPTNLWMDFETFVKCFKTIYIYHKPNTYACNHKFSDLKKLERLTAQSLGAPVATPSKQDKKGTPSVAPASSTKGGAKAAPTATVTPVYDDRAPHYMFVDNLKPSEIVVSFSSLSRWHDAPLEPKESKTSVKGGKGDKGGDDGASVLDDDFSDPGSTHKEPTQPTPAQPGLLVAEPYSWKSLVTGQPILRLKTTATKAAVLTLPPGRHVLRFMLTAPLGYHIHLSSSVQFVYGDEETVMEKLTAESCRFVDNAVQTMQLIGKCINNLSDPLAFHQSYEELSNCHCPYRSVKTISKVNHFKLFNESLYSILRKTLPAELLTPEMAFAWRTFNFDATTKNILGLTTGSRPGTSATSHRGSAKEKSKKQKEVQVEKNTPSEVDKQTPENWLNREPTPEEHVATIKLQKGWRGCYVRKIRNARMSGTEDHQKVLEQLQKAWTILEPNMEQHGLNLFRAMFKADPDLMEKYPFHKDEWNKISYADYQGSFPDQPAGTWFVVFREVFYVTEEMLVVPKMYCTIPNCLLRVVNNDTREEIPRVFQKVAPFVYKRNRRGYTFIAESRTTDQPLPNGKWRMRLIGSLTALPAPARNEVNCSFHTREIRDYYIPNEKCIIFRYTVKVTEEHVASLQMSTSKPDVYIKLMVLDHEEEVLSTVGKGHAVLPSFIFLKDPGSDQSVSEEKEDMKRANSRASNKGGGKAHAAASKEKDAGKRQGSAMSRAGSRTSSRHSDLPPLDPEEEEKENRPHKYIIQAMVMRNSWPLSESSWTFVQMLKDMEKNELKVANKEERPPSAPKNDKAQGKAAQGKGSKGKDKDKGAKDKQGSRPPSQQFDTTKPYWTLRIVSDGTAAEEIDVKKDTERADEIRAMKKAWEEAEPGRAAKALQSRLQYLSTHMIKLQPEGEEGAEKGDSATAAAAPPQEGAEQILAAAAAEMGPPQTPTSEPPDTEEILTLEPPPPPTPKEMLQPLDLTPYLRKSGDGPRYLDEAEIQRQMDAKRKEIEEYKAFREQVEQWREEDRQLRNQLKIKQLEECQALQAALDKKRNEINIPREAFRQKYLEAERKRLEELAAQEAALRAEQEKAPSPKGRKSAKGKKSPAGKKKK